MGDCFALEECWWALDAVNLEVIEGIEIKPTGTYE